MRWWAWRARLDAAHGIHAECSGIWALAGRLYGFTPNFLKQEMEKQEMSTRGERGNAYLIFGHKEMQYSAGARRPKFGNGPEGGFCGGSAD